MINLDKWNALDDQQKAMIEAACHANVAAMFAEGEAIQFTAMQELQDKGVTLHRWPEDVLDTLRGAWGEVATELAAEDESFRKSWDSLQAFRRNYAIWNDLGYLN